MKIEKRYLALPVNRHCSVKKLLFYQDGQLIFDLDVRLDRIAPENYFYQDMKRFAGQELTVQIRPDMEMEFAQTDTFEPSVKGGAFRPFVHFTPAQGWINDPNGLLYANGVYHLFFQHNPAGTEWGNMHWGHAVSQDLFHWEEKEIALFPDRMGTMFSGCGLEDIGNLTGLAKEGQAPLLFYYTAAGGTSQLSAGNKFTQCMAYSTDDGKTLTKFKGNPVLPHAAEGNRDPKVIFAEELGAYIMALYLIGHTYALYTSADLLRWEQLQTIDLPHDTECPDFYPLEAEGKRKWVLSGAADYYLVGDLTKGGFVPCQEEQRLHYGNNSYAAQTFSGTDKRIRIAWLRGGEMPESPFNKQMGIPCEMTLVKKDTFYLCMNPVKEIEQIYDRTEEYQQITHLDLGKHAYDILIKIPDRSLSIRIFNMEIFVDWDKKELRCNHDCAPLLWGKGPMELRVICDKMSMEIFAGKGQIYFTDGDPCDFNLAYLQTTVPCDMIVSELKEIWREALC